jgi:hypothetical protein
VLGHAETLLAAMRHLITNESCAAHFLHPGAATGANLHAVRRKHDQRERIALTVKRREGGTVGLREQKCCSAARWASSPRTPADLSGHAIILGPVSVSTNWSSEKGGTTASVRVASASWINQVERWFAEPTRKRLRRGVHTSVRQLEADIRAFIDRHNENPKPFKWTNLQTKSWLQLSASAAKLSRPYATKFRFT